MLKILQGRLQQYVNQQRPNVQDGFEKAEEPEIKLPLSVGSQRKQGNSRKKHLFLLHWLKSLTVWITTNWKILKEMGMPDHLTCLLRNLYAGQKATVRNAHGTNLSQIGKGVRQGCMLSPCLFNFYAEDTIWNTWLYDSQAGTKIVGRNINNLRYANDNTLTAESEEELKSLWMTVKEESEKVGLKLNIQKMKIMASGPITSWQIDGGKVETVTCFIFLGSKTTGESNWSHEIKRCLLLERNAVTNLDSILKSRDIIFLTKVSIFTGRTDVEASIFWPPDAKSRSWKRPDAGRLKAGGEADGRRWDGWMASSTQWTWVWASSGRYWRTGRPGLLQPMGSQRVRYDWTTTPRAPWWHRH